jgi:hypothetical protein
LCMLPTYEEDGPGPVRGWHCAENEDPACNRCACAAGGSGQKAGRISRRRRRNGDHEVRRNTPRSSRAGTPPPFPLQLHVRRAHHLRLGCTWAYLSIWHARPSAHTARFEHSLQAASWVLKRGRGRECVSCARFGLIPCSVVCAAANQAQNACSRHRGALQPNPLGASWRIGQSADWRRRAPCAIVQR